MRVGAECPEFAGEQMFQAADDLGFHPAFAGASGDVDPAGFVVLHSYGQRAVAPLAWWWPPRLSRFGANTTGLSPAKISVAAAESTPTPKTAQTGGVRPRCRAHRHHLVQRQSQPQAAAD